MALILDKIKGVVFSKIKFLLVRLAKVANIQQNCGDLKKLVQHSLYPQLREVLAEEDVYGRLPYVWLRGLDILSSSLQGELWLSYFLSTASVAKSKDRVQNLLTTEKLKILFVSGMFPNDKHGGGLRFFDIMAELSKRQHEVSLYTVFSQKLDGDFEQNVSPIVKNMRAISEINFTQEDYAEWLEKIGERYDVIYHLWPQSIPLMKLSKAQGAKVYFEYVECVSRSAWMDVQRMSHLGEINRVSSKFASSMVLECSAANVADSCIALTQEDANFIRQIMRPKSLNIFPTGVSSFAVLSKMEKEGNTLNGSENSAVFVGYYDHTPNIEGLDWYFSEIHSEILSAIPEFKVRIVGRGDLSQLKSKYQDMPGIDWVGEVVDIVPYILSSKVYISPLISGAGLRGKVIQYSILGRPTVSTNIGICGTPFVDGESVISADTATEFSKSVIRLIQEKELYDKISTQAKKVAQDHFSWTPVIEKMEHAFYDP